MRWPGRDRCGGVGLRRGTASTRRAVERCRARPARRECGQGREAREGPQPERAPLPLSPPHLCHGEPSRVSGCSRRGMPARWGGAPSSEGAIGFRRGNSRARDGCLKRRGVGSPIHLPMRAGHQTLVTSGPIGWPRVTTRRRSPRQPGPDHGRGLSRQGPEMLLVPGGHAVPGQTSPERSGPAGRRGSGHAGVVSSEVPAVVVRGGGRRRRRCRSGRSRCR